MPRLPPVTKSTPICPDPPAARDARGVPAASVAIPCPLEPARRIGDRGRPQEMERFHHGASAGRERAMDALGAAVGGGRLAGPEQWWRRKREVCPEMRAPDRLDADGAPGPWVRRPVRNLEPHQLCGDVGLREHLA